MIHLSCSMFILNQSDMEVNNSCLLCCSFWRILSALIIDSYSVFYACWDADYIYDTHIFTEDLAVMCENEFEEQIWKSGFAHLLWLAWFSEMLFFLVVTLYFILVSHIKGRFVLSYNKGSVNKFFKLYVISRTEIFIQCLNVKENQSPTKFLLFYNEYLLILEPFFPLYEQMLIAS